MTEGKAVGMPGGQVTTSQSRATLRCPSRVNGHPEMMPCMCMACPPSFYLFRHLPFSDICPSSVLLSRMAKTARFLAVASAGRRARWRTQRRTGRFRSGRRTAGAGCEFQCQSVDAGIGLLVGLIEVRTRDRFLG